MVASGNGDEKSKTPPAGKEGGDEMIDGLDFRGLGLLGCWTGDVNHSVQ
jgi:hypothetical protein